MTTDAAIWLLRWTLAGAAISVIVIAAVYALRKAGRVVRVEAVRAALLAALAAPIVALAPPVFTFSAPGAPYEHPERLVPRFVEKPGVEPAGATAPEAQRAMRLTPASDASGFFAGALVAVWLAGAAVAAVTRQRSVWRLARAFRSGAPFPAPAVECRLSADVPAPLLFGILRPRMLAPPDFGEWSDEEREAVLRHEAAHARRGDLVWAFVGDLVRIFYWHAPPIGVLVSQHTLATEEACDLASLGRRDDRHDYARALIAVARRVGRHASPGLAMTASSLRRRIDRLTAPAKDGGAMSNLSVLLAGAAAALALALSAPAAAGSSQYRLYIFNAVDGATTYALSDGQRAAAALVEQCVGRLLPNAAAFVDALEARMQSDKDDELDPVWIVGRGSSIELGSCREKESRDEETEDHSDEDSLVLVTDASEKQARKFIRQIDALSRAQRRQMAAQATLRATGR